ncbi:hypothetical protein EPN44_05085 [bacterium]|nr:MAG: hypothetical protein EPN44_05085 [bacterium]
MRRPYRSLAALTTTACALLVLTAGTRQASAALLGLGTSRSPIDVVECRPVAAQSDLLPPSVEIGFVNKSNEVMRRVDFVIIEHQRMIGRAIDVGRFAPGEVVAERRSSIPREAFADGVPALRCVTDRVEYMNGDRWHQ